MGNTVFDQMLIDATDYKCCKTCKHSWLQDELETGYCKLSENAFGILPRMVNEMYSCNYWEKKNGKR